MPVLSDLDIARRATLEAIEQLADRSSDPALKRAPTGWRMPVCEVRASVGAGFVYPICGEMRTLPGLGTTPAALRIDLDDAAEVTGLS